jgi:hypothetical protein
MCTRTYDRTNAPTNSFAYTTAIAATITFAAYTMAVAATNSSSYTTANSKTDS